MRCTVEFVLTLTIFLCVNLNAQWFNSRIEDSFTELDSLLTLIFSDAENGKPITGGKVQIENIGTLTTDSQGKARFKIPDKNGYYKAKFTKQGYITTNFEIEITAGTLLYNHLSISRSIPIGYLRVILDWAEKPPDLDVHFIKKNEYHISYRNSKNLSDGEAQLDRDDRDGFGPETITVKHLDKNAFYTCYIHDYSNRAEHSDKALSDSKATVKVYGNGRLLNLFKVPNNSTGTYWEVFRIRNGLIKPVNKISRSEPDY